MKTNCGLDLLKQMWPGELEGARLGLVVHPASVDRKLTHAVDIFRKMKNVELKVLFGPQHGIMGQTQDNMIEWEGFTDPRTKLPVFSLYGSSRKPDQAVLKGIDALVIDLQDVGSRYYTFIWTMALCMEACAELDKSVVVIDRPNPIGGSMVEGPVLTLGFESFVGLKSLPVRHGMTIGEIGRYLKHEFYPSLDYFVVPAQGWIRQKWFDTTGLPWVMPSPNMPCLDTATVYPGMCLLEGTNLSEGRGTTRPFEIFGAPFIDPHKMIRRLNSFKLPGVHFRPVHFQPTFQKYAGELCGGAQIHVQKRDRFLPFKTAVAILLTIRELYQDRLQWNQPPYEYETEKLPIDILAGTDRLRKDIDEGTDLDGMEAWWGTECDSFRTTFRQKYLMYD